MRKMTEENLKAALAGESQAHLKYLNFSERAKRDGKPNVARLFAAASFAEQVHASAHLRTLKGIGSTAENLATAIGGEGFEVDEMYPAYVAVAELQQEPAAKRTFQWALEAEKVHRALYQRAAAAVAEGKDLDLQTIWVCAGCGYTGEGDLPDKCPLCGAPKEKLVQF